MTAFCDPPPGDGQTASVAVVGAAVVPAPEAAPVDWLDHRFALTTFPDAAAATKHQELWTLRSLAPRILATTALSKQRLPWLKLAHFGDEKTPLVQQEDGRITGGSLRHNANVLTVTGVEADYDGGEMTVDEAVETLTRAGVLAMVYTSPSHTEDEPRLRVLCPFSAELPPERRDAMMGRLNGLFRGIFAAESWTLSQSYYFGAINHNPSHRVEVIDGTPIDLHDELDEIWCGKPDPAGRAQAGDQVGRPHRSSSLGVTANSRLVISALFYIPNKDTPKGWIDWNKIGMALHNATEGSEAGRAAWHAWSQEHPAYDTAETEARWQHYFHHSAKELGAGTIFHRAKMSGWRRPGGPEPPSSPEAEAAPDAAGPESAPDQEAGTPDGTPQQIPGLREFLSVQVWAEREIPAADGLLGDLLTTTSRTFLVGRTGLGKTNFGFAIACGMASGEGFLHWRSTRPARVLYIDGEMPGELIKSRSVDVLRRATTPPPLGNLTIFARDQEDEFAARFPTLGKMPPLNTEAGQNFIHALIGALGGVDVVIFDNVMSLIAGDQKDEVPWSETLLLVSSLTAKRIGQVWLDHTGHNSDRQYGSSTKAWRFDAVGVMTPLPDDQRAPHELAFTLSFEHPGKARRRTPENWKDFETVTIRLTDDRWTSAPVDPAQAPKRAGPLRPAAIAQYKALHDALTASPASGRTTRNAWYDECVRLGMAQEVPAGAKWQDRDRLQKAFRVHLSALKVAGWIGVDGETVTDIKGRRL